MGEKRFFCFSLRVLSDATAKFGSLDAVSEVVDGGDVDAVAWLVSRLMDAGHRYAESHGLDDPAPLSADELLDGLGLEDVMALRLIAVATVSHDSEAEVAVQTESSNPTEAK